MIARGGEQFVILSVNQSVERTFRAAQKFLDDHAPAGFPEADIEDFARTYPFAYGAEDRTGLARFIAPLSLHPRLNRWAARFLREDGSADTRDLLVGMTQTIKRTFKHVARHEKGIQDPVRTLKLASGSCRDLAVLMIAALRSLGLAARFVSGYLHLADDDHEHLSGGNTHAWVQAYVPGPGWVDLDLAALGMEDDSTYQMHDLLTDARYLWHGRRNFVQLDPARTPAHVLRLRRRMKSEQAFDYFL